MEMIEIDGSIGGGQVLRTAIGLSTLTLEPVKVFNIRADRPNPGVQAQHLAGVKAAKQFCKAEVEGAKLKSSEITFSPTKHDFSDKEIKIGTAGSIPLVMQTIAPILVFADRQVRVDIEGGTAGIGAPTIEYTKFVTFPNLRALGVLPPRMLVQKQGFFPKGGGFVRFELMPSAILRGREVLGKKPDKVQGMSVSGDLPSHVAKRQAEAAKKVLGDAGIQCDILASESSTECPGSSITLWTQIGYSVLGACALGELGKPSEKVGEEAASSMVASISSGAALDKKMVDQMVPFMALARDRSVVSVEEVTEHAKVNMSVVEAMLDVEFVINENARTISVDGIGFQRKN